jgi:hypothetical protein
MLARIVLSISRGDGQKTVLPTSVKKYARNCFSFLFAVVLTHAPGCSYLLGTLPPDGKISVRVISWKRAKKLAESDAGLSGRKVTILNPVDRSVIASGTTHGSGLIEFAVLGGNYILIGASDEPQAVQVQAGQTLTFKLVVHEGAASPVS